MLQKYVFRFNHITNNVYVSCNSRRLKENVKLKILSRNTLLLSLIFYIKITIMRIIQLRAANSPAHIEWDTLSQFFAPGIENLTHHAHHESLSRRYTK